MLQILIEDSGNLKHPKNVKSISNTTVYHLVSCRVIPRPATMKGWEKEVFWKIHALGNLKCNKKNNLESKQNPWRKYLKSNCIKSEIVQENFSSIFLKLQVTYFDSQEIVRTTALQNTSFWLLLFLTYYNALAILILIITNIFIPFWVNALLKFHAPLFS